MPAFTALYYPSWNPPPTWLRSTLLFFDRVEVIIPTDVEPGYSYLNRRLMDDFPDAFGEIREERYRLNLTPDGLKLLGQSFDLIAKRANLSPKQAGSSVGFVGRQLLISEVAPVHDAKVTNQILQMVRHRGLLYQDQGVYRLIQREAGALILSLLADSYARRRGLRTLTDMPLGYSMNTLNALCRETRATCALASTVIKAQVPKTISTLTVAEYVDLRNAFEPIREPFQHAMRTLCQDYLLDEIRGQKQFEDKVREATHEFSAGVEKARKKTRFLCRIKEWRSFNLGSVAKFIGLAPSMNCKVVGKCLEVFVQGHDKLRNVSVTTDTSESQRMIARLQNELNVPRLLRRLSLPSFKARTGDDHWTP